VTSEQIHAAESCVGISCHPQELLHSEPLLVCVMAGVTATNHRVIERALHGWFGCDYLSFPPSSHPAACARFRTALHSLGSNEWST
jgi:hypothetical protein